MEELSTGMRIWVAIISFVVFGLITIFIGTFSWIEVLQTGLLGTIAVFVVLLK